MAEENRTNDELHNEMDALKADMQKIQEDLRELAQTLVQRGRASANEFQDRARAQVESSVEQLHDYVEERPMTVVAGAFAAGLVFGMIFGRR